MNIYYKIAFCVLYDIKYLLGGNHKRLQKFLGTINTSCKKSDCQTKKCFQIIKNDINVIFYLPADCISVVQLSRHFPDLQTSYEMISSFSGFFYICERKCLCN